MVVNRQFLACFFSDHVQQDSGLGRDSESQTAVHWGSILSVSILPALNKINLLQFTIYQWPWMTLFAVCLLPFAPIPSTFMGSISGFLQWIQSLALAGSTSFHFFPPAWKWEVILWQAQSKNWGIFSPKRRGFHWFRIGKNQLHIKSTLLF